MRRPKTDADLRIESFTKGVGIPLLAIFLGIIILLIMAILDYYGIWVTGVGTQQGLLH